MDVSQAVPEQLDRRAVLTWSSTGQHTYRSGRVPTHLATGRQLREAGLSAAGLTPAGWLHYSPLHGICPLYDRAAARPVRPLTARQREVLAAGRALAYTAPCARCAVVRAPWRPTWKGKPYCDECRPIVQAEREAERQRKAQEAAEQFRLSLERDRADAASWAAEVLADPAAVVLDTETTGLDGAYLVEIAIVAGDGRVLLESLVNPGVPIPAEVIEIHGITDNMVRDAPTFAELLPRIEAALTGRRVVIYNAEFDKGIIHAELCRLWCGPDAHRDWNAPGRWEAEQACRDRLDAWTSRVPARIECAMEEHSRWFGEWHPYWQDYTWQRLGGGHRAAGDCRAVLDRLRQMTIGDPTDAPPVDFIDMRGDVWPIR